MHKLLWGSPGVFNAAGVGVAGSPYVSQATNIKPVLGIPLATSLFASPANVLSTPQLLQTDRADAQWTLRFSLSEPESGYPDWPTPAGATPYPNLDDQFFYQDYPTPNKKWPNHPWDGPNYGQNAAFLFQVNPPVTITPSQQSQPNPNIAANGSPFGTIAGYTTIYLQRLANPLAAWDAYANPYITVDSMDVNLTSYTGEWSASGGTNGPNEPGAGTAPSSGFDNLRRGELPGGVIPPGPGNPADFPNVWTPLPHTTALMAPSTGSLAAPLPNQSLGYLNNEYCLGGSWAFGMYTATSTSNPAAVTVTTGIFPANYYGDPIVPFPWLAWNDRPYVSQYELMLVPASGPSSLLSDVGLLGWNPANGGNPSNQYQPPQQMPLGTLPQGSLPFAQFKHLLNFYDDTAPAAVPLPGKSDISRLYRALDYIHVPSRFVGTQAMLNPAQFVGNIAGAHPFHPPFNWLNQYREPGRVNLNTTYDPYVFQGVMDDYPGSTTINGNPAPLTAPFTLWQQIVGSRRGYGGAGGFIAQANPIYPTIFVNPFRAAGTSPLVPPLGPVGSPTYAAMMPVDNATLPTVLRDVNSTLLRAAGSAPGGTANGGSLGANVGMFDANNFDTTNQNSSYVYGTGGTPAGAFPSRQAGRNPSFEYAPETRLGNLVTNHSNVYAVWITLGKFQVTAGQVNAVHPDGYYLGPELLDSTGNPVRSKAFYIYDRSIPVGFMRGENLNIEKAVLIERVLQ